MTADIDRRRVNEHKYGPEGTGRTVGPAALRAG